MSTPTRCPICGGPSGVYRLGACSPGCDQVMGDDESPLALVLLLLVVVAVIVAFVMVVSHG